MSVQLELSKQNLADIELHTYSRMTMTELVDKLRADGIVVRSITPFRPTGTPIRIDVVRSDFERYMELYRAPEPINGEWQPLEDAYVQY
ncbi:hypothetical protein pEaSNUABM5_00260 [Erwinia phage pEa_SNUABM_5]|uniref:Uncharacterized protein n=1 Tax=Erwinia phage pEa_SNUABM_5 TaxID=2797313 RepID=A0A7T8EQC1_9CAUD|nr:hypothetical protein MPK73_gp260 [Erwinia phage pEa_SNUABM_5]QQO90402.1 hypothetical protein pEaSNUABM5_00260 [Erwinia phage pEa_SNUABM_5]